MEIDLNKLMNYKSIAYASDIAQLDKVKEEYQELMDEIVVKDNFSYIKNRDNFVAEALDLVTATVNLLLLCGLTEQDFEKHIAKLESYKVGKYKSQGRSGINMALEHIVKDLKKTRIYCKNYISNTAKQFWI